MAASARREDSISGSLEHVRCGSSFDSGMYNFASLKVFSTFFTTICAPIHFFCSFFGVLFSLMWPLVSNSSAHEDHRQPNLDVWLQWKNYFPKINKIPDLPCSLCCFVSPVLQSVAKLVTHSAKFWNFLDERRTTAKKNNVCQISPPPPPINVDHSFWHYGHFVSGQHCAGGGGGKFYLGLGCSKIRQKRSSVSLLLKPIVVWGGLSECSSGSTFLPDEQLARSAPN